ncbi:S1 RNA-binding domain-containing protein 1 [Hemicordylus capensis]|uniref:S1 RNA-binding domain-containing protein 1 n=1 Tax=Hemicordylus capensis TaxID=884348 RepID=UPI00230256A3|nr:S1 RNA-binding domain-containing protein 1 [Hemicordylus capensis]XP_053168083.1 S1 RNA-binding domain-containing protein 1 [Hemicordylus capensis]
MSELPRRARTTAKPAVPEDELPSFLISSSESEEDQHEEEWEPKKKVTKRARMPKAKATTPKKATVTRKKPAVASKKNRKAVVKEEPDTSFPVSAPGGHEGGLQPKEEEDAKLRSPVKPRTVPPVKRSGAVQGLPAHGLDNTGVTSTSTVASEKKVKAEKSEEDFTFDEPPLKKLKSATCPQGNPVKYAASAKMDEDHNMHWDIVQVLSQRTGIEEWVCANIIRLFKDDNTIPFIARYRKELINNLEADALREVQQTMEELHTVAKKVHGAIQKLKKEGKLTTNLLNALLNCKTLEGLDHVYAPYKTGSKGTKAQRARQLGLEHAANLLIENPRELNLHSYVKPSVEGLSDTEEVKSGVQHILADMVAKDKDTLDFIRDLCQRKYICMQSSLSKVTSKKVNEKDVNKFHLYQNFSCNIKNIQHHQILAINRGENLKILTVKVNVPDGVKNEFCRWCVNERWRPKAYAQPELMEMLRYSVEDSYKRLIYPLLCREFRSKLTSDAEKESVMMFGRNLRQLLLMSPVRGRTLMGVDPGYSHGCKLAIISPTSQILHTDVVYLHSGKGFREAEKIRKLLLDYNCGTVVIGNGTACRETESYFADLIMKRYFAPLDVSYCITNEAGASIYSVSPEACKEMPDLDPNLRSAVSIARRVQDPLAELVKIEPKHIGVGMYQHDVSQTLLKATLDSVVEECVSFVGVDINICSEILLRHIAGLNANRAKNIIEWREKNGPFVNRNQLKDIKGLGPKSFQQCAGFIRVNQEYIRTFCSQQGELAAGGHKAAANEKPGKKKAKAAANIVQQPNPLDQTCVHPESYDIAMRFLTLIGGNPSDIGKLDMQQKVNAIIEKEGMDGIAKMLNTTRQTLQIITDGLTQPEGFDIRKDFDKPDFKRSIVCLEDLSVGTILTGRVENATLFGVFVDIGVGRAGLIPIRNITEDKLSKAKKRRSLGLGPGEKVEVRVREIDIQRSRITLDLIRVL